MKSNQKGFSVIEILLIIVVVGLIGTVGWLVSHRQKEHTIDSETKNQTAQLDNTSDKYSAYSSESPANSSMTAQTCSYVDVKNQESRNKKLTNTGITADAGSECILSNGDTLLSFSQTTSTTNEDNTISTTYKYGIVIVSGSGAAPKVNNTLACANIPPDPSNPPEISTVADNKAILKCPGYQGATYTYDFSIDKFVKN